MEVLINMANKTKLGISTGLLAAGMYFLGLANIIALVAVAIYVFVYEQDEWLRKAAVKAVGIVLFFTVISSLISLISNSELLLDQFGGLFKTEVSIPYLSRILSLVRTVLSLAQSILLLALGFKAMNQSDLSFGPVDKHLS
jgi:hypothetical protein